LFFMGLFAFSGEAGLELDHRSLICHRIYQVL
jgi:hypothetical protein